MRITTRRAGSPTSGSRCALRTARRRVFKCKPLACSDAANCHRVTFSKSPTRHPDPKALREIRQGRSAEEHPRARRRPRNPHRWRRADRNGQFQDRDAQGLSGGRQTKPSSRAARQSAYAEIAIIFAGPVDDPRAIGRRRTGSWRKRRSTSSSKSCVSRKDRHRWCRRRLCPAAHRNFDMTDSSAMKSAVLVFPGINRERDMARALQARLRPRAGDGLARRHRAAGRHRSCRHSGRLLLRRLSALRRDRGARADHGRGARLRRARAGSCSASATAFRSSARPDCCRAC